MSDSYESLRFDGERNAERLGLYVAWLAANQLLSETVEGSALTRLKMQDITGPDFLATVMRGELGPEHLTPNGRAFTEAYFVPGRFNSDFDQCEYKGEDEWVRYSLVAPFVTRAYRNFVAERSGNQEKRASATILPFRRAP